MNFFTLWSLVLFFSCWLYWESSSLANNTSCVVVLSSKELKALYTFSFLNYLILYLHLVTIPLILFSNFQMLVILFLNCNFLMNPFALKFQDCLTEVPYLSLNVSNSPLQELVFHLASRDWLKITILLLQRKRSRTKEIHWNGGFTISLKRKVIKCLNTSTQEWQQFCGTLFALREFHLEELIWFMMSHCVRGKFRLGFKFRLES